MRETKVLLLILFFSFLLVGCAENLPAETLVPPTPSLIPSITVPPLLTQTPWSTRTPLPTEAPTPTLPLCWKTGGSLVEDTVMSEVLNKPVELLIYLPPCYTQLTNLFYPTLYLIHGQGFGKDQWVQLGVVETIDRWVAIGDSSPVIVVMPQVGDWNEPDSFPFGQALVEEIIPSIERDYRAVSSRVARKVGGISRGAGWALQLGLRYWQTFSAFGGHSLPVFYADAPSVPGWLDAIPPDQRPQIFLDYAQSDQRAIRRSTDYLIELLEGRGYDYRFFTGPGTHDEEYWGGNIELYLQFYFEGW